MKKLVSLLAVALIGVLSLSARDRVTTDVNVLPQTAQNMIKKNFPKQKINHINIDKKTFGGPEYDVVLNDGTQIEFNSEGAWTEVERGTTAVPSALVIKPIRDYVANNFKGALITDIKVERNKYEIQLNNGLDLEFDRSGKFLRVDD